MREEIIQNTNFEAEAPRASKTLPKFGFVLTGMWLAAVLVYAWLQREAFSQLPPNAVGDFAAGAFAPLAFLWLVLGFFQQGEELRNSGRALWLQGRELQHSVEQQRELVNVTREQLQFESKMLEQQREEVYRNTQPILIIKPGGSISSGSSRRMYQFRLVNHGKACTAITIDFDGFAQSRGTDVLPTGGRYEFNLELPIGEIEPINATVNYVDERLLRGSKRFIIRGGNPHFDIDEI